MAKISAVIFDFDGTIVDGFPAAVETINELAKALGYPQVTDQDIDLFRHQGAAVFLKKLKIPMWKLPAILKRGQEIIQPKLIESPLVADMDKVLLKLKTEVQFLGIISTNSVDTVNQFLKDHQLAIFNTVVNSGLFDKHKLIQKMLQQFNLPPAKAVYVGDEPRDLQAAAKAGVNSVGVTWGYSAADRLEQEKPTWLVDKPTQLLQIIG